MGATDTMMVIMKDPFGYKIGTALRYDNPVFYMDDGRRISQDIYLATKENLLRMRNGANLMAVQPGMFEWPLPSKLIGEWLVTEGFGIEIDADNLRIRRKLPPPFTKLKPEQIGPIVMIHMASCQEKIKALKAKKDADPTDTTEIPDIDTLAQRTPVNLIWMPADPNQPQDPNAKPSDGALCYVARWPDQVGALPELTDDPGKFCKTKEGKQFAMSWHDYQLIPKNQNVYTFYKFLPVEDGPFATMKEAEEMKWFVTMDGVLCQDGASRLTAADVSIDDFLK